MKEIRVKWNQIYTNVITLSTNSTKINTFCRTTRHNKLLRGCSTVRRIHNTEHSKKGVNLNITRKI